jgi:hypothetical protein
MTRRLLIFDQYDVRWLKRAMEVTAPGDEWDLLLLGLSDLWFRRRFGNRLARLGTWQMINLTILAPEAQKRVNGFMLDFISKIPNQDLGGQTLAQLLNAPEGNRWWYLETSEKSPFRTPLVGQLYRLALVRLSVEQSSCDEVWLALSEGPLMEAISGAENFPPVMRMIYVPPVNRKNKSLFHFWLEAAISVGSFLFVRLLLVLMRWPKPGSAADARLFFLSFYPYWWLNSFTDNATDRFFTVLPNDVPSRFVVWLSHPLTIWRHRRAAAKVAQTYGLIALQHFINLRDMFDLLSPDMFLRLWRFERRLSRHLHAEFAGFDISELVRTDITRSLCSAELSLGKLFSRAFDNFARRFTASTLLYRVEFQPWENALLFGISKRMKTVGFLHSPFGKNYLPMRFASGELARYLSNENHCCNRPLPDGMLVSGPVGVDRLTEDGFPPERIAICGPQRQGNLLACLRQRMSRTELRYRLKLPTDGSVFFVAIAIDEADTEALFAALATVGTNIGDFHLIVKPHPTKPPGDMVIQAALASVGKDRASVMPPKSNMYDYMAAADAMICVGSTIAFEAMALDVMPIVFENPATFAITSLAEFDSAMFIVRDATALRLAFVDVITNSERIQTKRRAWPEVLKYVFWDLETPLSEQMHRALARLRVLEFVHQPKPDYIQH